MTRLFLRFLGFRCMFVIVGVVILRFYRITSQTLETGDRHSVCALFLRCLENSYTLWAYCFNSKLESTIFVANALKYMLLHTWTQWEHCHSSCRHKMAPWNVDLALFIYNLVYAYSNFSCTLLIVFLDHFLNFCSFLVYKFILQNVRFYIITLIYIERIALSAKCPLFFLRLSIFCHSWGKQLHFNELN